MATVSLELIRYNGCLKRQRESNASTTLSPHGCFLEAMENRTSLLPHSKIPASIQTPVINDQNTVSCSTTAYCLIIYGKLLPVVCTVSLICSLITIRALVRMRRSTINICFLSLFITDTVKLGVTMLLFVPLAYCEVTSSACAFHSRLIPHLYPTAVLCYAASMFICVIITLDRYLVISHPFRVCYFTRRRTLTMLLCVLAGSVVFALPAVFELRFDERCNCVKETPLRRYPAYMYAYHLAVRAVMGFGVVFLVMLTINMLTLVKVVTGNRTAPNNDKMGRKNRQRIVVSIGCVLVVCVFLITNILPGIIGFVESVKSGGQKKSSKGEKLLVYIGNALVAMGPGLKAAVYCGMGSKFRSAISASACSKNSGAGTTNTISSQGKQSLTNNIVETPFQHISTSRAERSGVKKVRASLA